jgi:hypothetical protein
VNSLRIDPEQLPLNGIAAPVNNASFSAEPAGGVDLAHLLPTMLRRFEGGNLRYVVMRNYQGYPRWGYKPDIGLLVDDCDIDLLIKLFRQTCDELGYAFFREVPGRNNVVLMALRTVTDSVSRTRLESVKVDARTYESFSLTRWHRSFHPLSYKVFLDDTRRRRIVQDNCVFHVYEPLDEFIMLFKQWRRKRRERYRNLIIERLAEPQLRKWFRETVGTTSIEPQQMIAADYEAAIHDSWLWRMAQWQYGRSTSWRMIRTHWRALVVVLRQLRPRRAPMIYFTGPDGCGKSTVLESVKQTLAGGVIDERVRFRHFYSFKNVLLHITRWLWWLKSGQNPEQSGEAKPRRIDNMTVRDRDTGRRSWRLRKLLALLVGLIDIRISYLAAWWCRWRGIVVLVETSPYDIFAKYHMPEFPWIERVFAPLLPRPNLCFVLRANPQSIVARKAELTVEEITDFYQRVDRVISYAGIQNRAVSLPTDVSPDLTFARAAAEVINQIGLARIDAQPQTLHWHDR